jgi:hypothetical protein
LGASEDVEVHAIKSVSAFLAQQTDMMDAIQRLRAKAQANNKLTSTTQQKVTVRQEQNRQVIAIEPTDPNTVYVPYYDPAVVYGDWPYADYPPYYFPDYYAGYIGPGLIATGIAFGAGYALSRWISRGNYWGGGINWNRNTINVNRPVVNPLNGNVSSRCSTLVAVEPTARAQGRCPQIDPPPATGPRRARIDPSQGIGPRPRRIDRPHGAGPPRSGSRADLPAEAALVWGVEAGALPAASEVEACEAAVGAAAEGALISHSSTISTCSAISIMASASIASATTAATKPMSGSLRRKFRRSQRSRAWPGRVSASILR